MSDSPVTSPPQRKGNNATENQNTALNANNTNESIVATETRKLASYTAALFYATCVLCLGTLAAVGIGIWQGTITRDALKEQYVSDSIRSMKDNARDTRDSIHTVATLDSTGRQIGISRETMQRSLRAYILLEIPTVKVSGDTGADVMTLAENHGETPTDSTSYWIAVNTGPESTINFIQKETIFRIGPIQKSIFATTGTPLTRHFSIPGPQRWRDAISRSPLFVWGQINYKDVFGFWHHTSFRYEMIWDGATFSSYHVCSDGNESN
jgi:hypothetical protein